MDISLLANRLQTVMSIGMKEITPRQWLMIIMIGTFQEPPTLKELAQRCGITHQSAKQLLNRLAEKGYICILPNENDKRAMRIKVSEKAQKWRRLYEERNTEFVYELFEELTEDEREVYYKAQKKLLNKLERIANENPKGFI